MNLEIPRGKMVAVVGPSGVGKSSLLSCLAGLLPVNEGELTYRCNRNCEHSPKNFQKKIGIVFQHLRLTPTNSCLTNVLCGRLGRYPWWKTLFRFPSADRKRATELLTDLGLSASLHRWVSETSGGEQQRVAVARALFQEPELYLADEPVSNLDTYYAGRVLGLLKQECALRQCSVLCVLHDAALVERFADLVLSLDPSNPSGWRLRTVRN